MECVLKIQKIFHIIKQHFVIKSFVNFFNRKHFSSNIVGVGNVKYSKFVLAIFYETYFSNSKMSFTRVWN